MIWTSYCFFFTSEGEVARTIQYPLTSRRWENNRDKTSARFYMCALAIGTQPEVEVRERSRMRLQDQVASQLQGCIYTAQHVRLNRRYTIAAKLMGARRHARGLVGPSRPLWSESLPSSSLESCYAAVINLQGDQNKHLYPTNKTRE